MTVPDAPFLQRHPRSRLPSGFVPLTFVPMKLPTIRLFGESGGEPPIMMPPESLPLMTLRSRASSMPSASCR